MWVQYLGNSNTVNVLSRSHKLSLLCCSYQKKVLFTKHKGLHDPLLVQKHTAGYQPFHWKQFDTSPKIKDETITGDSRVPKQQSQKLLCFFTSPQHLKQTRAGEGLTSVSFGVRKSWVHTGGWTSVSKTVWSIVGTAHVVNVPPRALSISFLDLRWALSNIVFCCVGHKIHNQAMKKQGRLKRRTWAQFKCKTVHCNIHNGIFIVL